MGSDALDEPDPAPDVRARVRRVRGVVLRALACVVLAGVLGAPLAASWAVTHTVVHDQIGTSPTTFTLSTTGTSELRLGIAGAIYVPNSLGPVGVVATVDGPGDPGAGDGDLANYVRPEMLRLYAGLFHDPQAAIDGYVHRVTVELRHQLVRAELVAALGGGALLLLLSYVVPWPSGLPHRRLRAGTAVALALVLSTGAAVLQVRTAPGGRTPTDDTYALDVLDGTLAAGARTNSPVISAIAGTAVDKAQLLVDRQTQREAAYRQHALDDLAAQSEAMEGPRPGETAVLMQSDMHCNTTMIRLQHEVVSMLRQEHGDDVPALMAVTGDLTTNGTGAEAGCVRDEAAVAEGAPIAAVTGNHESDVSRDQMREAGMTVLDGSTEDLAGVRVLGDGDPNRTELFGATVQRGDETQQDLGHRLRGVADDADVSDRPDLVLVHEAYAAESFLGIDSVSAFLANASADTLTEPTDDGIDDVPAGAIFYGHWHRSIEPRVIWNSDGTWTLVMELDTSGGAIDTPTINNFSTPWSRPQQEASFPVVFLDQETQMVTGYQLYRFETDGTATVLPRVDVGTPVPPPGTARRGDDGGQ